MKRRTFVRAGTAATLAAASGPGGTPGARAQTAPAIGGRARNLIHVPQSNLTSLDPVWTTAASTRNHAHMVWETLYGRDTKLDAKPQMLEGHLIEDGGKRWTMKLREGLRFHDGEPVRARDAVASIRRWMKRDQIGLTVEARLDSLEATDDRTLVWRLQKPFAALPYSLCRHQPSCVIMPERLAQTDPFKQVPEIIGSGPFRFVTDEFVTGSRAVYARNENYVPRNEPVDYCAGGYRVMVDRVEWRFLPDASTAANALVAGEVDWLEQPLPDLLPLLRRANGVVVRPTDIYGTFAALRPNHMHAPTDNRLVRRAMLAATSQQDVMTAMMGDQTDLYRAPVGYFLPGTPSANEAGMDIVRKKHSQADIRAMLKEAGYNGERIVYLHPTDQTFYDAASHVLIDAFRKVGLNIDAVSTDWGTVVQRRTSRAPLDAGGWSLFPHGLPAAEYRDPIFAALVRANGQAGFFGWANDPVTEELRDRWIDSSDPAEQRKLDHDYQARAFHHVPFIPLGQYFPPAAYRSWLTHPQQGVVPVFWGVEKNA
jgi:peptide/nickel transport system substrate-binding protein